jgi:hypothetical protein
MEIEEVLQVEKNLATDQRTRRRRSRFVVQGGLGRCIKSLSFTLWIYEKQKNKVLYRNQIASSPRLGNALGSWCTTVQHHAVDTTVDACLQWIPILRDKTYLPLLLLLFQVKGGGTVGNALTAASGLGLNARIFTKVISLSSYFITPQQRRVWRRGVKERIQRFWK